MPDRDSRPSPLRELLAHIEAAKQATGPADDISARVRQASPSALLDEFQQLWSDIRTDSQLRQSMATVRDDAGPLHSSALLHRAMTLMQDVAPGYLQHFISYADALSGMEQLREGGGLGAHKMSRNADSRSAGKPRARKRPKSP